MAKKEHKRYRFNPQTLTYEVITIPFRVRFYRLLRKILIAFILASLANLAFSYFFYTPKMYRINKQREELVLQYNLLNNRIHAATARLDDIRRRDNGVYRALFAVDTMNIQGVYTPYPDAKYASLDEQDRFAPMIRRSWTDIDALGRRLYAESRSLDDLQPMAADKEKMTESVPAIWPLDKRKIRSIGAFGGRTDPVYGGRAFHEGMDFSGPVGTPIYATGNGRVMINPTGYAGYGRQIMIDHGFGYRTRYAHLSRIAVIPGQSVKRGEKIGELGNSGKSTGPHLHYEVIVRGTPVNPVNYFSKEMSDADFANIIASARETTFEVD
ncbi:MAG: M23 family metallopeptidase [Rikenellaceae bacterium]|jgi:murein DD-endopeptidase MepM/ murein hydrolase activator NlpD|nr:M23 family metallopeptidase [Rikenellaceae bacterium]